MRRPLLGALLLVLALAYAWIGVRAADPTGAAVLLLPETASESARWIVTQLWGAAMTGYGVAGVALLLGRLSPMGLRLLAGLATLASILVARCFAGAGDWTALAILGSVCAVVTFLPAVRVSLPVAPRE